ncbi:hypothetical protein BT69DRAFT_1091560 [Atractiella rhizophila]|nr:hypothetical protein BT69DRAFT_1091560 [Atractiella rhizophila]
MPPASPRKKAQPSTPGRPALPTDAANPAIRPQARPKRHEVKVQELKIPPEQAGGPETRILIARVRIPMPKGKDSNALGHVIKRFDTDSLSASSLFKAAFPNASDDEFQSEMDWIKSGNYGDTAHSNREDDANTSSGILAGTWIPMRYAETLAVEYGTIAKYTKELFEFQPPAAAPPTPASDDKPTPSPRRSLRSPPASSAGPASTKSPPSSRGSTTNPATAIIKSPPAKRARVGSPARVTRSTSRPPVSNGEVKVTQTVTVDKELGTETEKTDIVISGDASRRRDCGAVGEGKEVGGKLERGRVVEQRQCDRHNEGKKEGN